MPSEPAHSGLHRRHAGPALRKAHAHTELDALLAVIDILERESTTEDAFAALVDVVRHVVPFDVMAIVEGERTSKPLVYCSPGLESLRSQAESIVESGRRYFLGGASLDSYVALIASLPQHWISLPLSNDGEEILGVMTMASSEGLGEETIAFLACIARHFARMVGNWRQHAEAERESERARAASTMLRAERSARAVAEANARVNAWVADMTDQTAGELSRDRGNTLTKLTHGVGEQFASGCAVDFAEENGRLRRIAHLPGRSEAPTLVVLDRLVAVVMTGRRTLAAIGGGGMANDPDAEESRIDLAVDWLISTPIVIGQRIVGVFTVFGEGAVAPALSVEVVERLARGAATAIAKSLLYEDARAMVQERDQMLSTVSHDLKNPLGVILMSAAYLLDGMPPNERRRAGRAQVEAIHRNARRMKRLVTDLLDIDSIEAGRMKMMPAVVHPRTLVNASLEDTLPVADAAGVLLRRGTLVRLPLVWADGERILQVLLNLLTNAVKFTPRGGRITVRARRTSETDVTFVVQDNGIGIAAADLPHIFERHWQAPTSGAVHLGAGLGLAICKSIVELSGGQIRAESQLGRGTTMLFTLPVASVDAPPA